MLPVFEVKKEMSAESYQFAVVVLQLVVKLKRLPNEEGTETNRDQLRRRL